MGFIEIKPRYGSALSSEIGDGVVVKFTPKKNTKKEDVMHLEIVIGIFVARRYGYTLDTRIGLFVDENNPFLWQLRKSNAGFKLHENSKHFKIQCRWTGKTPKDISQRRFCSQETIDGHLQVRFCQDEVGEL